jgi:hypothetical protein
MKQNETQKTHQKRIKNALKTHQKRINETKHLCCFVIFSQTTKFDGKTFIIIERNEKSG